MSTRPKTLRVTLIKSLNGRLAAHKACAAGLGLRRIRQTVTVQDTPSIRGMIDKISYMVKFEEGR
jgi:large subunit ribosomal protein L30